MIHLDLKPDNIRVSEYSDVVLVDWGLGQILASDAMKNFSNVVVIHDLNTNIIGAARNSV